MLPKINEKRKSGSERFVLDKDEIDLIVGGKDLRANSENHKETTPPSHSEPAKEA